MLTNDLQICCNNVHYVFAIFRHAKHKCCFAMLISTKINDGKCKRIHNAEKKLILFQ